MNENKNQRKLEQFLDILDYLDHVASDKTNIKN